jgi:ribosomal protein L34E
MLINIDYRNRSKSTYFCDICGKRFNGIQIIKLIKFENKERSKICDLCSSCYKILNKTIIKLKKEKGGEIIE